MKPLFLFAQKKLCLIWILMIPLVGTAQTFILNKGDTIRVRSLKYFRDATVGQLLEIQNDSLTFRAQYGKTFTIPCKNIVKLKVARGVRRNTKRGAIFGGISTGVLLGVVMAIDVSDEQDEWLTPTPGQAFVGGLIFGGLLGGVTGAIIGSGSHSPRWVEVPVDNLTVAEKPMVHPPAEKPPARGQEPVTTQSESRRRWRVSFSSGNCSSGPAKDIEQAMRRDGFDDTSPGGFFGGPVDHPFSNTGFGEIGVPWTLEVSYTLKPRYDLALLLTRTPMGETFGYQGEEGVFLFIKYDVTTLGPVFIFKPGRIVQLGLGPAWVVSEMERETGEESVYQEQKGRLGAVLQGALLYPTHTRFFVKLDVQYRWVPDKTFGPIPTRSGYYDISPSLKEFKANFSHTYIGFGMGIHF
ncbi:MAG: hypothetical protein D6681_16885 [Calditrichaeota bacterium]|nr:MAG: hypothetical protein D6681_16885 [Calditrichota bacterium]